MSDEAIPRKNVEKTFSKPGQYWTSEEFDEVYRWLFQHEQLTYLLVFALYYLGQGADFRDAEDALVDFYIKRLELIVRLHYDPEKGRFWNYLLRCFGRYCQARGKDLRKRRAREKLQKIVYISAENDEAVELELTDNDSADDPHVMVEQEEMRTFVQDRVNELEPKYRSVITMFYFKEKSISQIASELRISESNVKVRLLRARRMLKDSLQKFYDS